jgi:hypothetical protein
VPAVARTRSPSRSHAGCGRVIRWLVPSSPQSARGRCAVGDGTRSNSPLCLVRPSCPLSPPARFVSFRLALLSTPSLTPSSADILSPPSSLLSPPSPPPSSLSPACSPPPTAAFPSFAPLCPATRHFAPLCPATRHCSFSTPSSSPPPRRSTPACSSTPLQPSPSPTAARPQPPRVSPPPTAAFPLSAPSPPCVRQRDT